MVKQDNSQRLEFVYDYLGRRVQKIVRSGPNSTSPITRQRDQAYGVSRNVAAWTRDPEPALAKKLKWTPHPKA
jgi:hypothetical protein